MPDPSVSELWNPPIKAERTALVAKNIKQIDDNCPVIIARTESAAMDLPGAQQQIDSSKQSVQTANDALQRESGFLDGKLQSLTTGLQNLRDSIEAGRKTEAEQQVELGKSVELNALRKEQSTELRQKYTSSFHSSWLGLWRPLKETTPMGLLIASIVFGLVGIASIVFYIKEVAMKPSAPSVSKTTGSLGKMMGGFLKQFL